MNAQEQREQCPVKIGQTYKGGRVIYILGDKNGWDIFTKHERIATRLGLIRIPVHREEHHRIDNIGQIRSDKNVYVRNK